MVEGKFFMDGIYAMMSGTWYRHFSEPEFLNFYGAQESIPRNQFRKPM
jgi:hypothetical protein